MPTSKLTDVLLRAEFAPSVLSGAKSMTRRLMNPQPSQGFLERGVVGVVPQWPIQDGVRWFLADGMSELVACPYGGPGDRIRFLSTWAVGTPSWSHGFSYDKHRPKELPTDVPIWTAFDGPKPDERGKLRPGRFMPLWMRERLPVFEIMEVRAERVREISEADAIAEGIETDGGPSSWHSDDGMIGIHKVYTGYRDYRRFCGGLHEWTGSYRFSFQTLWESINGEDSWARNDWVWAIAFRRLVTPCK